MTVKDLPHTIWWSDEKTSDDLYKMCLIDQTRLPLELVELELTTWREVTWAIKELVVRGAPAIGVAGAMALALWTTNSWDKDPDDGYISKLESVAAQVAESRPTAINLAREVFAFVKALVMFLESAHQEERLITKEKLDSFAIQYVKDLCDADVSRNMKIGAHGAELVPPGGQVITHCNAGSLATVYYGTALGVIYAAHERGLIKHVYVDETRPVNQGSRLTMWELMKSGVPCTLQCDSMAADLMAREHIDVVIVGADRIAVNGDTANKIGTYQLALAAAYHNVPFYVAAPSTTFDKNCPSGDDILIEFRDPAEVLGTHVARAEENWFTKNVEVRNPSFDITPHNLISAFITEEGVIFPEEHVDGSINFNFSEPFATEQ